MATFWFETCVEGNFCWKLPVGRQFKSLEEYSPLLVRLCSKKEDSRNILEDLFWYPMFRL
jgi:hypothetical protein